MKQYLNLLKDVLENGKNREDRTGVGTRSVFGRQIRFDLQEGFPLLTTKKVLTKAVVHELLWFLSGDTNIKYLQDNNVKIWDAWADKNGDLGPVYGKQWRNWDCFNNDNYNDEYLRECVDQIRELIENLKTDPFSRRHIVSAWNVSDLSKMALMPCHTMFQFYVEEMTDVERWKLYGNPNWLSDNNLDQIIIDILKRNALNEYNIPKYKLSCQLYQRSGDIFLGVPFNIASYALLTHMIAQVCGFAVGEFVHTFGDLHLYNNHVEQAKEQLTRDPNRYKLCKLELNPDIINIDDFKFDDIKFIDYESYPFIKGEVAI